MLKCLCNRGIRPTNLYPIYHWLSTSTVPSSSPYTSDAGIDARATHDFLPKVSDEKQF